MQLSCCRLLLLPFVRHLCRQPWSLCFSLLSTRTVHCSLKFWALLLSVYVPFGTCASALKAKNCVAPSGLGGHLSIFKTAAWAVLFIVFNRHCQCHSLCCLLFATIRRFIQLRLQQQQPVLFGCLAPFCAQVLCVLFWFCMIFKTAAQSASIIIGQQQHHQCKVGFRIWILLSLISNLAIKFACTNFIVYQKIVPQSRSFFTVPFCSFSFSRSSRSTSAFICLHFAPSYSSSFLLPVHRFFSVFVANEWCSSRGLEPNALFG